MLATTLALVALAAAPQDAPRLRTILPSGAIVFAENMPRASSFSLVLVASSRGVREAPETHGWRHLLEHLLVKGPDKGLQARLEAQGLFVSAETNRDTVHFSITGNPSRLDEAMGAVREILQPLRTTPAELEKEVRVLRQELALEPVSMRLSRLLWSASFGTDGLDPIGSPGAMEKASASALELMRRRHFAAQNLVLSLVGPFDVDDATRRLQALLPSEKGPFEADGFVRIAQKPSHASDPGGEARGVPTPGWSEPETAAILAAALALASEGEDRFVTYTPSTQPGLVIVGAQVRNSGFGDWVDGLKAQEIDALFPAGKALAASWVLLRLETPEGCALLRGMLYAQSVGAAPETMLENIRGLSPDRFRAAVERFRMRRSP